MIATIIATAVTLNSQSVDREIQSAKLAAAFRIAEIGAKQGGPMDQFGTLPQPSYTPRQRAFIARAVASYLQRLRRDDARIRMDAKRRSVRRRR